MTTLFRIRLRRDTAANWATNNPKLAPGELGLEEDTGKVKLGVETSPGSNIGKTWNAITEYWPPGTTGIGQGQAEEIDATVKRRTISSGNETLKSTDAGRSVDFTGGSTQTMKLPKAFSAGVEKVFEVCKLGTGELKIEPESGLSLYPAPSGAAFKLPSRGSAVSIRYTAASEAVISGDYEN